MKKLIPILSACCLLSIFSCRKEILLPDSENETEHPCFFNCDTSQLEIVWQEPIQEDTGYYWVRRIIHDDNKTFYGVYDTNNPNGPVYGRDANTGDQLWKWDDYHSLFSENNPSYLVQTEDYLVVNYYHQVQAVDKNTGENKWVYSTKEYGGTGLTRMSAWEDDIFHIQMDDGGSHKRKAIA